MSKSMFNKVSKSMKLGAHELKLETGEVARQADGAVMVSYGETVVLVTVVGNQNVKEGQDFFPINCGLSRKNVCCWKNPWRIF